MGFNTVAVLLNDFTHEFEGDGPLGKRIAHAMMPWNHGSNLPGLFQIGQVAAHSGSQGRPCRLAMPALY
jgi:hypothetical protein